MRASTLLDPSARAITNFAPDPRCTKWGHQAPAGPGPSWDRWTAYTAYSLITNALDGPPGTGITSYGRATITGGTNNTGLGFHISGNTEGAPEPNRSITVTEGQIVTVSLWVRSSAATPLNQFHFKYRYATPGSTTASWYGNVVIPQFTLAAGVWQRVSFTTSPTPAGVTQVVVNAQYNGGQPTGTTLDATGLMVTLTDSLTPYADGESTGWRWNGIAHQSSSVGYAWTLDPKIIRQKVRNSMPSFEAWTLHASATYYDGVVYAPAGVTGVIARSPFLPCDSVGDLRGEFRHEQWNENDTPGQTWTAPGVSGYYYTVDYYDVNQQSIMNTDGFTSNGRAGSMLTGQWARATYAMSLGPGIAFIKISIRTNPYVVPPASIRRPMWATATTAPLAAAKLDAQAATVAYQDGTLPEWAWLGEKGINGSEGYPYTLDLIAGPPLALVTTPGTSSGPLGLEAFEARTLYVVSEVIDQNSNLASQATIGLSNSSGPARLTIRHGGTGGNGIESRFEGNGGGGIYFAPLTVRTVGRHVSVATLSQGATEMQFISDYADPRITSVTLPGTGSPTGANNLLWLGASTSSDRPFIALAYRGEHDLATRRNIMAWLARQYDVPIVSRNQVPRNLSLSETSGWVHNTDANPATISIVNDTVPGTPLIKAVNVAIPTSATRSYSSVCFQHNVAIKVGEQWTLSFYIRRTVLEPGSDGMNVSLRGQDYGNAVADFGWVAAGSDTAWKRLSFTFTATGTGLSNNTVFLALPNAPATRSCNVRLAGVMLERGDGSALPYQVPNRLS